MTFVAGATKIKNLAMTGYDVDLLYHSNMFVYLISVPCFPHISKIFEHIFQTNFKEHLSVGSCKYRLCNMKNGKTMPRNLIYFQYLNLAPMEKACFRP